MGREGISDEERSCSKGTHGAGLFFVCKAVPFANSFHNHS